MNKIFNKILVVESKKKTEKHLDSASKLRQVLESINANFIWVFHKELTKEKLIGVDLVITLGGDGTFIETANLIEDSFILGINSHPDSSEGALTSLSMDKIKELKEILSGKFKTILRQRARVKLNNKILNVFATNEIYVGAESQFHTSRYKINFNGSEEEHRSSGVIVSTGTGSPAWFYSAGGEIFNHDEEKLSFIVREPYYGKRVFKPTLLRGDIRKNEKIIIESTRNSGGIIAINDFTCRFNKGDIVEIELADKPLKVIKLDNQEEQ